METIVNSKKIFFFILFFSCIFIFFVFYSQNQIIAHANESKLNIEYIGDSAYPNHIEGAKYLITTLSDELSIAFDDYYEWQIRSDNYKEGEIPYVSVFDLNQREPSTYGMLEYNEETRKHEYILTLRSNGELFIKSSFQNEEPEEIEFEVKIIDWLGPQIILESLDYWTEFFDEKYILNYILSFTDTHRGLRYPSSISGVDQVEIFMLDSNFSDFVSEKLNNPYEEFICTPEEIRDLTGYEIIKLFKNVGDRELLDFKIQKSGFYYYVAFDKASNFSLGFLGEYLQLAQEEYKLPLPSGSYLYFYEYLLDAMDDIKLSQGEINEERIIELQNAINNLIYIFSTSASDTDKWGVYQSFMTERSLFKDAMQTPYFTFTPSISPELELNISCINFNETSVNCINGDNVELVIEVVEVEFDERFRKILERHPEIEFTNIYSFKYELKVNGELSVPKKPLVFHLTNYDFENPSIFFDSGESLSYYSQPEIGINFLRFNGNVPTRTFYLFVTSNINIDDGSRFPWWGITLISIFAVLIPSFVIFLVIKKKRNKKTI